MVVGADGTNDDINAAIGGEAEKVMRCKLGETVDKYADVVFVTTQSPKNEDAAADLLEDVVDGFEIVCTTYRRSKNDYRMVLLPTFLL